MLQLSKEDIEAIADAVAARARHAESAQPSGAPAPASAQGEVCEKPDAASPVKTCPFGPVEASVERFLRAIEARLDVDDDDAHILSRDGLELLKLAWSNRRSPAPSPAHQDQCPNCGGGVHAKGCGVLPSYSPERGWTDG